MHDFYAICRLFRRACRPDRAVDPLKKHLVFGVACAGLFVSGPSVAHNTNDSGQMSKILQELQAQGRELRNIQALLEARDADRFAREITEDAQQAVASEHDDKPEPTSTPPTGAASNAASNNESTNGAAANTSDQAWQRALAKQARRVKGVKSTNRPVVNVVRALEAAAPNLSAALTAVSTHPALQPELRQMITLALRRPEVVPDWVDWLDGVQAQGLVHIPDWIAIVEQQGHLLRTISLVRTPLRAGSLNLSRGRRTALAAMLGTQRVKRSAALSQSLRADLENLFIYGDDRLYTYSLLKPMYRTSNSQEQEAAWADLIQRAWRQSRHSAQAERTFAPLAARMGNHDALQVWVSDALAAAEQGAPEGAPTDGEKSQKGGASALSRITNVLGAGAENADTQAQAAAKKAAAQAFAKFQQNLSTLIAHPRNTDVLSYYQANRDRLVFDTEQRKYVAR